MMMAQMMNGKQECKRWRLRLDNEHDLYSLHDYANCVRTEIFCKKVSKVLSQKEYVWDDAAFLKMC